MWATIISIALPVLIAAGWLREVFGKRGPDGRVR